VLQHLIDTERVFSYRALCIARKDPAPLPSMDEINYVQESAAYCRTLKSLKNELLSVRTSTNLMFRSFDHWQLKRKGMIAGHTASVNGIGFIIFAHLIHHQHILTERYMV
jgi:hypothetical protein